MKSTRSLWAACILAAALLALASSKLFAATADRAALRSALGGQQVAKPAANGQLPDAASGAHAARAARHLTAQERAELREQVRGQSRKAAVTNSTATNFAKP